MIKVAIGADHGGFELKEHIVSYLKENAISYKDLGTHSEESCDYNDVAISVATAVREQVAERGILICGTGVGMSIQANKVKGIRAGLIHDVFTAKASREHNDTNILAMGGRVLGPGLAVAIVDTWLHNEFSGEERHRRRIHKIENGK